MEEIYFSKILTNLHPIWKVVKMEEEEEVVVVAAAAADVKVPKMAEDEVKEIFETYLFQMK